MSNVMDSIMQFDDVQEWLNKTILLSNNFETIEQAEEAIAAIQAEYYEAVKDRDTFLELSEEEKIVLGEEDRVASIAALEKYVSEKKELIDSLTGKLAILDNVQSKSKNEDLTKLIEYMTVTLREDLKNSNDISLIEERLKNVTNSDISTAVNDIKVVKEFRVTLAKNQLANAESLYRRLKAVLKECNSHFKS